MDQTEKCPDGHLRVPCVGCTATMCAIVAPTSENPPICFACMDKLVEGLKL